MVLPDNCLSAKSCCALAMGVVLSACAGSGPPVTQSVMIQTPDVVSARCVMQDSRGRETVIAGTPGQVTIDRRGGPYNIACSAPGFAPASLKLVGIETGTSKGVPLFPPEVIVDMRMLDGTTTTVARMPPPRTDDRQLPGLAASQATVGVGRPPIPEVAVAKPSPPPPGGFSVQVGAFRRMENAERLAGRLRSRGYPARLVPGPDLTRVRFGSFPTREEAARAARRYKREEGAVAYSVRN